MTIWEVLAIAAGIAVGSFGYQLGRAWRRRRADKRAQQNLNNALASIQRTAGKRFPPPR